MSICKQSFKKGDRVFRFYTAEPAFIYGGGRNQENGVVIADPFEWDGKVWVPVKWEFSPHPDLARADWENTIQLDCRIDRLEPSQ